MSGKLFSRLVNVLEETNDYFKPRKDCCKQLSFSPLGKCMAALGIVTYGKAVNAIDVEILMGKITCLGTTVKFARNMMKVFGPEQLREKIVGDTNFFGN